MDYRELLKESNQEVKERFELATARIREIACGEVSGMPEAIQEYFHRTAVFLSLCADLYAAVEKGKMKKASLQKLQEENKIFYQDIMPENYGHSYANPAYAVEKLGEEFGRILSFLYTELRSERIFIFEKNNH